MVSSAPTTRKPSPRTVAVVGGGPAGLMAADVLSTHGHRVTVFDRMPSVGRKFLMAGRGGLNITHSEPLEQLRARYSVSSIGQAAGHSAPQRVLAAIDAYPPASVIDWFQGLNQETFTGSSGRVFPKSFKASPTLRTLLARLNAAGVTFRLRHEWQGWDRTGTILVSGPDNRVEAFAADAVVLALGGASWPRLGSDGQWIKVMSGAGIPVVPLAASNCGVRIAWSDLMKARHAGEPLKRIAVSVGGETRRGETVITQQGLEGNVIYALSGAIRAWIEENGAATLLIDLRPDESADQIKARLSGYRGRQSMSTFLRKALKLSPAAIGLLHEAAGGPLPPGQGDRARLIKAVPVRVEGLAGLDRAISSSGGVPETELDSSFMLNARPGVFLAGEMLDWDAPTGGYLLQACFATAVAAAQGVVTWLESRASAGEPDCRTDAK